MLEAADMMLRVSLHGSMLPASKGLPLLWEAFNPQSNKLFAYSRMVAIRWPLYAERPQTKTKLTQTIRKSTTATHEGTPKSYDPITQPTADMVLDYIPNKFMPLRT